MLLNIGDKAPDFSVPSDTGQSINLASLRGKKVVLYFYPKDDTSGCTAEACDFRDSITQFRKLDCVVLGVSKDSVASHKKFKSKYGLNFNLLSDENSDLCETYGTWVEKSMYGRNYMGIERSTFLINENGIITHIWRKVSVSGHIDEVQSALTGKTASVKSPAKSTKTKIAKPVAKAVKKGAAKKAKPSVKKAAKKPVKKSISARKKPTAKKATTKSKRKKA